MNDRFDKIEAYIKKELSEKELVAFQKEMVANEELAKEVQLHRLEWEAMHLIREDKLRAKLKTWQKETPLVFLQRSQRKKKRSK